MSESPTGDNTALPASEEPTGQQPEVNPAESQNQETTSNEQSQEAVSDDESANQTQNKNEESGTVTDDGLAKFAKSQGIEDLTELSEREQKFLKIAHDNQKAARSNTGPKLNEAAKTLTSNDADGRLAALEYKSQTDDFFGQEGRDRSLETTMTEILKEKVTQLTPQLGEAEARKYAFNLSRDLDTLYGMATLRSGAVDPNTAKEEGRREAITSIRKAQTAAGPQAHAVQQQPSQTKVDADWVANTYDPNNKEHVQMLDAYMRGDLY